MGIVGAGRRSRITSTRASPSKLSRRCSWSPGLSRRTMMNQRGRSPRVSTTRSPHPPARAPTVASSSQGALVGAARLSMREVGELDRPKPAEAHRLARQVHRDAKPGEDRGYHWVVRGLGSQPSGLCPAAGRWPAALRDEGGTAGRASLRSLPSSPGPGPARERPDPTAPRPRAPDPW
jgi:hypothetical protein